MKLHFEAIADIIGVVFDCLPNDLPVIGNGVENTVT